MKYTFLAIITTLLLVQINAWTLVPTTGEKPLDRNGGKMVEIGGKLVLFAGFKECFDESSCEHIFYNDTYHLDLSTNVWERQDVTPDPIHGIPDPMAFLGACVDEDEDALVIYGGTSYPVQYIDFPQWNQYTKTFDKLWYYYPDESRWEYIETFGLNKPSVRSGAEIQIVGRQLILS